jgi:hypothetical protein
MSHNISNVRDLVMNEIKKRHSDLFDIIKDNKIFNEDQILYEEDVDMSTITGSDTDIHCITFFEVVRGEVYFLLVNGQFLCIHSSDGMLKKTDIDRDIRIQSIQSLSFEGFLEIVPKEVASRYLYHLDFFQEYLKVIKL